MHYSNGFSLNSTIPYKHWNVRSQFDVNQRALDVASLVRWVRRAVFMLCMFCSSARLGLIVAWQGEKKKKVPYCFPAVDSCCYATNRMSLSTGYIKFVFPAHLSARSFYTVTGGYGSGFLKGCSMKCALEFLFRCSQELQWRQSGLAEPFFVFGWMGYLCNTVGLPARQKGVVVIFPGVGWYCQAAC